MKFIYDTIKTRLLAELPTELPTIDHVRLWNNQVIRSQEGSEPNFPLPIVFIGFPEPIEFEAKMGGVSEAIVIIRLHIVLKLPLKEDFEFFTLKDSAFFAVNRLMGTDIDGSNFNPLVRSAETYDEDRNILYHFMQDYTTIWTDCSGSLDNSGIEFTPGTLSTPITVVDSVEDC